MQRKDKVRLGIIGAGGISQLVHIPGFQRCKHAEVVAICDPAEAVLHKSGNMFTIKSRYTDYKDMLQSEDLDVVCIATPNDLHAPIVSEAAKRGLHILCEKPIALNQAEAKRMHAKVQAAGIVNMVAYTYRYVPAIRFLKQLIAQGRLGKILHFRAFYLQEWGGDGASWRTRKKQSGSGELGDVGSHLIDFGRFLVGELSSVCGMTRIWLPKRRNTSGKLETADVDDAATFLGEFDNGATGLFEATRFAPGRGCGTNETQFIEVNGEKGTAFYDYHNPGELQIAITKKDRTAARLVRTPVPAAVRKYYGQTIWKAFQAQPHVGFRYKQCEEFIEAIRAGREVSPNFDDGLQTQTILDAILNADRMRKWVGITPTC